MTKDNLEERRRKAAELGVTPEGIVQRLVEAARQTGPGTKRSSAKARKLLAKLTPEFQHLVPPDLQS